MDKIDKARRSANMARIRSRDTGPELLLRRALFVAGLRGYRLHTPVIGKPDLTWRRHRVAVFVDGAFWHGHPSAFRLGRSGEFWDRKITGNVNRDRRVTTELEKAGWTVLRFWDFEVERDTEGCIKQIARVLSAARGEAAT